jgi:hypothetical protein
MPQYDSYVHGTLDYYLVTLTGDIYLHLHSTSLLRLNVD